MSDSIIAFCSVSAHSCLRTPVTARSSHSASSSHPTCKRRFRRRAAAAAAATLVALTAAGDLPLPLEPNFNAQPEHAEATALAPTPINPYARRRARKTYETYLRRVEERIEELPLVDVKRVVETGGGGLSVGYRVAGLSAFVAAALSVLVVHPIDSIKTRLQAGTANAEGAPPLFSGLYRGVLGNILKEAPAYAIYLGVYEAFKTVLMNASGTTLFRDIPILTFLLAGALGDAVGSLTRVPAELLNKRLQLRLSSSLVSAGRDVFLTVPGRSALRQAWVSVLMRDVPFGGLQIMLYELGKTFVHTHAAELPSFLPTTGLIADTIVGSFAGAFTALVTTPADVIVTRIALASGGEAGIARASVWAHASAILRQSGVGGLFAGAAQRAAYFLVLSALFFGLYEKTALIASHPSVIIDALHQAPASISHHLSTAVQVFGPGVVLLPAETWTASLFFLLRHWYSTLGVYKLKQ